MEARWSAKSRERSGVPVRGSLEERTNQVKQGKHPAFSQRVAGGTNNPSQTRKTPGIFQRNQGLGSPAKNILTCFFPFLHAACLLSLLTDIAIGRWRCRRTRSPTWSPTTGAPSATRTPSSRCEAGQVLCTGQSYVSGSTFWLKRFFNGAGLLLIQNR